MPFDDDLNNDRNPLGRRIRDLINPALDDDRRGEVQRKCLDEAFAKLLEQPIEQAMEKTFAQVFNHVSKVDAKNPGMKNPAVIDLLTAGGRGEDGGGIYNPVLRISIPISTAFTQFTADDIKECPSYIKLHELARELDVALRVTGLTTEDSRPSPVGQLPAILFIDGTKSYEDGAGENGSLYPELPPRIAKTPPRKNEDFDLG